LASFLDNSRTTASAGWQWTGLSTTQQNATTQPEKVLILTLKLWKLALFAQRLKNSHHSSKPGQNPELMGRF
jgi:hypothetical protein